MSMKDKNVHSENDSTIVEKFNEYIHTLNVL